MTVDTSAWAVLSPEQRAFFDSQGYLTVPDALPPATVAELNAAIDEVMTAQAAGDDLNLRNCLVHHPAFRQLLDWPATAPLAWQILGWNVAVNTTHLIVLPSQPEPDAAAKANIGLHRDGGTSSSEMTEPHPRIMLKIAYILSDQTPSDSGATVLVPGSNRLLGRPATDPATGLPVGAMSARLPAGSAFLFEQRTWHGAGHNWSGRQRRTIFIGYGYRWTRPMDYIAMPEELLAQCNPVQRQLLGVVSDPLSFFIPRDEDVPLKGLMARSG